MPLSIEIAPAGSTIAAVVSSAEGNASSFFTGFPGLECPQQFATADACTGAIEGVVRVCHSGARAKKLSMATLRLYGTLATVDPIATTSDGAPLPTAAVTAAGAGAGTLAPRSRTAHLLTPLVNQVWNLTELDPVKYSNTANPPRAVLLATPGPRAEPQSGQQTVPSDQDAKNVGLQPPFGHGHRSYPTAGAPPDVSRPAVSTATAHPGPAPDAAISSRPETGTSSTYPTAGAPPADDITDAGGATPHHSSRHHQHHVPGHRSNQTGGAEAADAALVVPAGSELVLPFRILLPTGQAALPPSVEGESGPEALGAPRDVVDSTRAFNIRYSLTVDITEPGAILRSPARHRETIFLPCLPRFNAVDARAVPASPDPESVANNVTCLLPVPVFAPTDAAAAAAANAAAVASALRISAPIGAPLAPGDSLPVSVAWLGPHPSSTELAAVSGLRVAIVDARLIELADLRELPAAAASAAVPAVAAWTAAALGTGARDARPVAAAELFVNAAAAAAAGDNTGPAASAQPSAPQQLQEHHVRIALRVPQLRPVRTLRGGLRAIGTGAPPSAAAATGGSSASSTAAPVAEPPADPTGVNPDCVVAPLPFSASAPTAAAAAVWSASVTHRLLVSVCVRLDSGAAGSPLPPPPASVAAAEAAEVAAAASTSRPAPEWRVVRAWAPVRVLSYSRAAAAAAAAALPATLSTQMQSVGLSPHRASHVAPTTPTADSSAAEQALPSRTTQKSAMPIPPGAGIPVVITPPAGHPSTSKAA